MAKFFKEDLDKLQKNREHGPGSLIKDLGNLGIDEKDEFLKGFPKTPSERAAEKAEEEARDEAAKRVAEEQAKIEAEADKIAILEAEQETRFLKMAMEAAEKIPSGQVKTPVESLSTKKDAVLDAVELAVEKITQGVSGLVMAFVHLIKQLGTCFKLEGLDIWHEFLSLGRFLTQGVRNKVSKYYTKHPHKLRKRHKKNREILMHIRQARDRFIAREKAAAARMVGFINHVDNKNEAIADKTNVIVKKSNKKVNFAREWAEINKKKLLMNFGVLIVVALCGVAVFNYCTAYEYAYNGRILGVVERQEDVLKIVDIVSKQLSKEHNAEIYIDRDRDITFNRVSSLKAEIDDTEEVLKRLTYMKNMNAKAYAIYVNDVRAAIVDSKETAESILTGMKSVYSSESANVKYEDIGFKEKIEIKQIDTKLGRIQNTAVAEQKLLTGAVSQQLHQVAAGDTLSDIAKRYSVTIAELKAANPTINPERLSIGQQIVLTKPAPMLTIKTIEIATYLEAIPYEIEYNDSSNLYKGDTKTEVAGVAGERSVTARITRENGTQVAATVLASETLSNPTKEVITRGTKEKPKTIGTGHLKYPVSGYRLTSKYGGRWGRMHYGLDLACPTGTRIGAADGGTVIFSGYSGSYGYVVKINHGGGMVTIYAHCSKLLVKKGDKVYQGQHIANVGSTGRSTGPHCHFEVQINGTAKNPASYL